MLALLEVDFTIKRYLIKGPDITLHPEPGLPRHRDPEGDQYAFSAARPSLFNGILSRVVILAH